MQLSPMHVGVVAGGVTAVASGLASNALSDRYMEKHPTGSKGDRHAAIVNGSLALGGMAAIGASMMLPAIPTPVGAGIGAGLLLGGIGAGFAYTAGHGTGVEAQRRSVFGSYDHNGNGQLDLEGSRWRLPEDMRVVNTRHEDDDGDVHYDQTWYEIREFGVRADANGDRKVTRDEATALISSYDTDGDERLKGSELRQYHREVGERTLWNPGHYAGHGW